MLGSSVWPGTDRNFHKKNLSFLGTMRALDSRTADCPADTTKWIFGGKQPQPWIQTT